MMDAAPLRGKGEGTFDDSFKIGLTTTIGPL